MIFLKGFKDEKEQESLAVEICDAMGLKRYEKQDDHIWIDVSEENQIGEEDVPVLEIQEIVFKAHDSVIKDEKRD